VKDFESQILESFLPGGKHLVQREKIGRDGGQWQIALDVIPVLLVVGVSVTRCLLLFAALSVSDPDALQEDTQFFAAGLWPGPGFLAIGE